MNTIKKIIASSVVNAIPAYVFRDNGSFGENFGENFGIFALFSAIPVITDKLINQNITSNKAIQYGLTAAEAALALGGIEGYAEAEDDEKFSVNEFKGFFSPLFSTDLNDTKFIVGVITCLSFAHKYIWDSTDDTNVEFQTN